DATPRAANGVADAADHRAESPKDVGGAQCRGGARWNGASDDRTLRPRETLARDDCTRLRGSRDRSAACSARRPATGAETTATKRAEVEGAARTPSMNAVDDACPTPRSRTSGSC